MSPGSTIRWSRRPVKAVRSAWYAELDVDGLGRLEGYPRETGEQLGRARHLGQDVVQVELDDLVARPLPVLRTRTVT